MKFLFLITIILVKIKAFIKTGFRRQFYNYMVFLILSLSDGATHIRLVHSRSDFRDIHLVLCEFFIPSSKVN